MVSVNIFVKPRAQGGGTERGGGRRKQTRQEEWTVKPLVPLEEAELLDHRQQVRECL